MANVAGGGRITRNISTASPLCFIFVLRGDCWPKMLTVTRAMNFLVRYIPPKKLRPQWNISGESDHENYMLNIWVGVRGFRFLGQ